MIRPLTCTNAVGLGGLEPPTSSLSATVHAQVRNSYPALTCGNERRSTHQNAWRRVRSAHVARTPEDLAEARPVRHARLMVTHDDSDWLRLGQCLREARGGRPRNDVAAASGVSRAQIQRYEEGVSYADVPDKLHQLAAFYGWPPGAVRAVLAGGAPPGASRRRTAAEHIGAGVAELEERLDAAERRIAALEGALREDKSSPDGA